MMGFSTSMSAVTNIAFQRRGWEWGWGGGSVAAVVRLGGVERRGRAMQVEGQTEEEETVWRSGQWEGY